MAHGSLGNFRELKYKHKDEVDMKVCVIGINAKKKVKESKSRFKEQILTNT